MEIAAENSSTTIFPVPIDILKPFLSTRGDRTGVDGMRLADLDDPLPGSADRAGTGAFGLLLIEAKRAMVPPPRERRGVIGTGPRTV